MGNFRKEEKMADKFIIDKQNIENAKNIASKIENKELRKRAYALGMAALTTADFLTENGIDTKTKLSLFRSPAFAKNLEIADIYSQDARLDVRLTFDENYFTIPKTHEIFETAPDAYIVVKPAANFESLEILGFVNPQNLEYPKSETEYFTFSTEILEPVSELKTYLDSLKLKTMSSSPEENEKIKELAVSFIDDEISESEKVFFIKHVVTCAASREVFCELNEFDSIIVQIKNHEDLLNDSTLSVLTGNKQEYAEEIEATQETQEEPFLLEESISAAEMFAVSAALTPEVIVPIDAEAELNLMGDTEIEDTSTEESSLFDMIDDADEEEVREEQPEIDTSEIDEIPQQPEEIIEESAEEIFDETEEKEEDLTVETSEITEADEMSELFEEAEENLEELAPLEESDTFGEELVAETIEEMNEDPLSEEMKKDFSEELCETNISEETNKIDELDETLELEDLETLDAIDEIDEIEHLTIDETFEETIKETAEEIASQDISDSEQVQEETEQFEEIHELEEEKEPFSLTLEGEAEDLIEETEEKQIILEEEPVLETQEIEQFEEIHELEEEKEELPEPVELNYDDESQEITENVSQNDSDEEIYEETEEQFFHLEENVPFLADETAQISEKQEEETSEYQDEYQDEQPEEQVDNDIQGLLDDDLLALLSDEEPSQEPQEDSYETEDEFQNYEEDTDENIETLFEKNPDNEEGGTEEAAPLTMESYNAPDVSTNAAKKVAITAALLVLLAGGAGAAWFMNNSKSTDSNQDMQNTENKSDSFFEFENKSKSDSDTPAVSQDINKSMANSFSDKPAAITITKISWQVSEKLAMEPSVKEYLQTAGKNIQMNLQSDLSTAADVTFNPSIKVSFTIGQDNTLKGLQVLDSSGSDKIDETVLRSIKNTLKYVQAPKLKDYKSDYFLTIVINF